jgi:uncharacterized membrane protein YeaQ/YmgE (transglycosylase-associated protein family)
MRIGSSRYYISSILGSKLGYTNTARYSYACLAEQNGVRLICVTMQSELSTDKYNDMRTLLDYAFSTFTGYTDLPARGITAPLSVVGGGGSLVRNIAVGVIGSCVGGLLFGLLGFSAHSLFANIIVSVVGACVFLFVARRLTK